MARGAPNDFGPVVSTVICCVDIFLVKLAEATVVIACGMPTSPPEPLKSQREDDSLRGSSQLPDGWKALPISLGSGRLSSAAKRLCIQLMFAVYIIGPSLDSTIDPWNDSANSRLHQVMKAMDECALQESVDETATAFCNAIVAHKRVIYAMIVSLFCATDQQLCRSSAQSPLKPRTFGNLLELISVIVGHGESVELGAIVHLDAAQNILFRWSNIVPWSWKTWDDPRVAGSDCIVRLTATWLYHVDCPDIINSILMEHAAIASSAMVRLLEYCFSYICQEKETRRKNLQRVLSQTCRAMTFLLRHHTINNWAYSLARHKEIAKYMLGTFVFLDSDEKDISVKTTILEGLTLLQRGGALQNAVLSLCTIPHKDDQLRFTVKLDDVILQSRKCVMSGQMFDTENVRLNVCFLTLTWYNGASKYIPRQSFVYLLRSLVNYLEIDDNDTLRGSVVTAFSVLGGELNSRTKELEEDTIWEFFVTSNRSNLGVAASFAHYVLTSGCTSDSLRCAEAWDYLRDVLTLIIGRHFTGEEEAAALLVCDLICVALFTLIQSNSLSIQFILSSPWTMSLCSDLKELLKNGRNAELDYNEMLKRRMSSAGKMLLDLIYLKLKSHENGQMPLEIFTPEQIRVQLISYHNCCALILMPASV
ncbi:hypothetical protein K435DRAFT_224660 [Dendrothele bispora CBS 962.96]|uniref:DUF4042 domain-containing protein n=1 Tax=Dendrothele bispora (strain CBS 962.96) TaxID=1314807 RepID=A0A4V4HEN3_DENBC|nr:hypothetical protein K435DRAFT_224660 [Dendrothele bispora CBS 962.96]